MSAPMTVDISLDMSTGSRGRGAWDDRDLVRAYDAALEEFHIHHPGPGSWLDKATAAMARGQPLPGARTFGTEWYSASDETAKRKRAELSATAASASAAVGGEENPYSAPVKKGRTRTAARAESPAYAPPSPSASPDHEQIGWTGDDHDAFEERDEDIGVGEEAGFGIGNAAVANVAVAPASAHTAYTASSTSYEQAIANAMSAQYAAGYWLGVAHTKAAAGSLQTTASHPQLQSSPEEISTNVVKSRMTFPVKQPAKLRR